MTDTNPIGSAPVSQDMFMRHIKDAQKEAVQQPIPSLKEAQQPAKIAVPNDHLKLPVYSFPFDFTDARGKRWQGEFTNKILSVAEQINVGTVRARMQVGLPPESFSIETYEMLYMLTWLSTSITNSPAWANDWGSLLDVEIMRAVWEHVQRHEETFHGRRKSENPSKAEP